MELHKCRWLSTGALTITALLALGSSAGAAEVSPSAYAAKVALELPGAPPANVGPLALADRSNPDVSMPAVTVPKLVTTGIASSTVAIDQSTGAQAVTSKVADLNLGSSDLPVAGLSVSALTASCTAQPNGEPAGQVELDGAQLGTTSLPVNPTPNQAVDIAGPLPGAPSLGKLVLNEQIKNADGSLTVYGAHLTMNGGAAGTADAIFGAATCGPVKPPTKTER